MEWLADHLSFIVQIVTVSTVVINIFAALYVLHLRRSRRSEVSHGEKKHVFSMDIPDANLRTVENLIETHVLAK